MVILVLSQIYALIRIWVFGYQVLPNLRDGFELRNSVPKLRIRMKDGIVVTRTINPQIAIITTMPPVPSNLRSTVLVHMLQVSSGLIPTKIWDVFSVEVM